MSDSESGVSIEVAEGVQSVIMKNVHTDFDAIRKFTPKEECLISPVVYLHAHNVCEQKDLVEYKYKTIIPHYLPAGHNLLSIKVRCGNIKRNFEREIRKEKSKDRRVPYYDINADHITLYSNHFCDVLCTSTEKVCTTKVMAIPFGWIGKQQSDTKTLTRIRTKTYICSYLYADNGLQFVSLFLLLFAYSISYVSLSHASSLKPDNYRILMVFIPGFLVFTY